MLIQNLLEASFDVASLVGVPVEEVVVLEGGEADGREAVEIDEEGVEERFEDCSVGWSCREGSEVTKKKVSKNRIRKGKRKI